VGDWVIDRGVSGLVGRFREFLKSIEGFWNGWHLSRDFWIE
jgi:hypothetical protein